MMVVRGIGMLFCIRVGMETDPYIIREQVSRSQKTVKILH